MAEEHYDLDEESRYPQVPGEGPPGTPEPWSGETCVVCSCWSRVDAPLAADSSDRVPDALWSIAADHARPRRAALSSVPAPRS